MPQDKKDFLGTWDSRETEFITHKQTNKQTQKPQTTRVLGTLGQIKGKRCRNLPLGVSVVSKGCFSRGTYVAAVVTTEPEHFCLCLHCSGRASATHAAQEAARTTGKVRWMYREAQERPPHTHTLCELRRKPGKAVAMCQPGHVFL